MLARKARLHVYSPYAKTPDLTDFVKHAFAQVQHVLAGLGGVLDGAGGQSVTLVALPSGCRANKKCCPVRAVENDY
jgi:hypothetical protein